MIGARYNNAVDPYFETNVRGAAAAGLRVGVYLYSYATTTAMAESDADFVLNLIKDYPISYPVVPRRGSTGDEQSDSGAASILSTHSVKSRDSRILSDGLYQ